MKKSKTPIQASELQSKRTTLLKLIQKFRTYQPIYMPGLIPHLNHIGWKEADADLQKPEVMLLWLPSSFNDPEIRANICPESLCMIEDELRFAQLGEALSQVRRQLRQRVYVGKLKTKNGSGQAYWLRSNTFISQVEGRIRTYRGQYDASRAALLVLRGEMKWMEIYRELRNEDVRGIGTSAATREEAEEVRQARVLAGLPEEAEREEDLEALMETDARNSRPGLGEGKRMLSWIWYTVTKNELGEDDQQVELSECIQLLLRIVARWSGSQVYVPSGPRPEHEHTDGKKRSYYWKRKCAER
jgi:hypothetical protein